jgi:pullulanase/glycogen debranching enzyme
MLAMTQAQAQLPSDPLEACNATGFQTVLQAAPAGKLVDARAVWLNRKSIQWPGLTAQLAQGTVLKLYHAADSRLQAQPGQAVTGAQGAVTLQTSTEPLPATDAQRFRYLDDGLRLVVPDNEVRLPELHRQQLLLVQEDAQGRALQATAVQAAGALDDLYQAAFDANDLGVSIAQGASKASPLQTRFKLWAPTAQAVALCLYPSGRGAASRVLPLQWHAATGIWSASVDSDLSGQYYTYLVDVPVRNVGLVRNRVTDPYAVSLNTDSKRAYIADLDSPRLKPLGWDAHTAPATVQAQTDMVVYELHVRDFSASDARVPAAHRGKYLAFTDSASTGMRHLRALAQAGLTDVHLLPVFDFATVPESGCVTPRIPKAAPDSEAQQAAAVAGAANDCFNWGYDPFHFNAAEGSYASDAGDGAKRIVEFRRMVMALHQAGLRVGMDVVYNHLSASGQQAQSVLDRIVPGYYHRLDATGKIEQSTCCANSATEHRMMAKLMQDSVALWARHYRIDSFRFDLMGHQPRAAMELLQARADAAAGRHVNLIGEGWNFGEVADGKRFMQASQLSLNGSGIGTFNDRLRDALRGGGAGDSGQALVRHQGYINGLGYDPNASGDAATDRTALLQTADLVRAGLAGSLRAYPLTSWQGKAVTLQDIPYGNQPAGYASQPGEVVNYVENHDNETLYDINAYKLPLGTSREERVRVQMLGAAITLFSQGVAYFHAGVDLLRSKSMDRNSFDSGDWFNRLDWRGQDNTFGSGLPPKADNGANYPLMRPLLANPDLKPRPQDMAQARAMFADLLKLRASSTLFRLRTAEDVQQRLCLLNTGPQQNPVLLAGHLDGRGYPGAHFAELLYLVNVDKQPHELVLAGEAGKAYHLHPVQAAPQAADSRPRREARYEAASGRFSLPARSAVVFVVD